MVWEYRDDSKLVLEQIYPNEPDELAPRRVNVEDSALARAATSGQTIRLRPAGGERGGLAVPLAVNNGLNVIGILELRGEDETGSAAPDSIDAVETLASHGAIALEASRRYSEQQDLTLVDGLTKISNRRRLDGDLRIEVVRSSRYGRALTLLMVDVDHFKSVNDTFGHSVGDDVLKAVATGLSSGRETDSTYRFGGEEFAVLLRETTLVAARGVAERLRRQVKEQVAALNLPREVTVSVGVAAVSEQVKTAEQLVAAADAALYEAKQTGRNRVVLSGLVSKPAAAD